MIILASFTMPEEVSKRLPFENKSKYDSPIYQSSIAVIQSDLDSKGFLVSNSISLAGILPFVNINVSNSSKHAILRGKSIEPGLYLGFKRPYKAGSLWKHDALYLNNSQILGDPRIVQKKSDLVFSKTNEDDFVSSGKYRGLACPVVNPIHGTKHFYGVNIHRGPSGKSIKDNYSLGCITVEPATFDKFMKTIPNSCLVGYIHDVEKCYRGDFNSEKLISNKLLVDIYHTIRAISFKEVS